jgi:hypothetical protein
MTFMMRSTFKDKVDEDIYRYKLMLELGALLNKNKPKVFSYEKYMPQYLCRVYGFKYADEHALVRVSFDMDDHEERYEICEIGNHEHLYIINLRTHRGWGRNFMEGDERNEEYTFFDSGNDHEDEYLDSKLDGGVINISEEEYFQQSLIRDDMVLKYEDLPRYMEALTMDCTEMKGMCFYMDLCPEVSTELLNTIYDDICLYFEEF